MSCRSIWSSGLNWTKYSREYELTKRKARESSPIQFPTGSYLYLLTKWTGVTSISSSNLCVRIPNAITRRRIYSRGNRATIIKKRSTTFLNASLCDSVTNTFVCITTCLRRQDLSKESSMLKAKRLRNPQIIVKICQSWCSKKGPSSIKSFF